MIVCMCANVSERELVAAIAAGCTTVKDVERRCGAGSGCGSCRPMVREYLARVRPMLTEGQPTPHADLGPL